MSANSTCGFNTRRVSRIEFPSVLVVTVVTPNLDTFTRWNGAMLHEYCRVHDYRLWIVRRNLTAAAGLHANWVEVEAVRRAFAVRPVVASYVLLTDIDTAPTVPACSVAHIVAANVHELFRARRRWALRTLLDADAEGASAPSDAAGSECTNVSQVWFSPDTFSTAMDVSPPVAGVGVWPTTAATRPNVGWMLFHTSPRTLHIVTEWLDAATGRCRREATVHPRNQNVWNRCVHAKLCTAERVFLHPKLVGHQWSRIWRHAMMVVCWTGSHSGQVSRPCKRGDHKGAQKSSTSVLEDHAANEFRSAWAL
eukprot:4450107-Prymnesium_polylepis.1